MESKGGIQVYGSYLRAEQRLLQFATVDSAGGRAAAAPPVGHIWSLMMRLSRRCSFFFMQLVHTTTNLG